MTVEQLRSDLFNYDKDAVVSIVTPDMTNMTRLSNLIGIYAGCIEGQPKQLLLVGDREERESA